MAANSGDPIIVYDGVCNLCNGVVRFIIERDPAARFRFAPMQGQAARALIEEYDLPGPVLETFVLIADGHCLVRSDAALAIARDLRQPWPLLTGCRHVPRPVRDFVYNFLAQRRYRWFGRRDECLIPDAEIASRFLL